MTALFETKSDAEVRSRIADYLLKESERYQLADGSSGPDASKWGFQVVAEAFRHVAAKIRKGEY